jgi:peptidoglycan/xylan/chitin deacetylase (PgdA/CDA1 family)/glycosyltransferase involved in cell wall biosynthesis
MSGDDTRVSVIVPAGRGREDLLRTLQALWTARRPWPCEVVVVDDTPAGGDAVGEAGDLSSGGLPTTVVRSPGEGPAAACNRGAEAARGRWLLFLDHGVSPAPDLLVTHDAVLGDGADAVVGRLDLAPGVPRTAVVRDLQRLSGRRDPGAAPSAGRLALAARESGSLAVRREVFAACGGFDLWPPAAGAPGIAAADLVVRLLAAGADVRHEPRARVFGHPPDTVAAHLAGRRRDGRADVALVRSHPSLLPEVLAVRWGRTPAGWALRALASRLLPHVDGAVAGRVARWAGSGAAGRPARWALALLGEAHHCAGVHERGGLREAAGPLVLAYHAITDLDDDLIGDYCVPPDRLEEQLLELQGAGAHWIGGPELMDHLRGRCLPGRSVLLTFDDAYAGLWDTVVPLLRRLHVPAMVMPVTDHIGGHNRWDVERGATSLPLLTLDQLRAMTREGWSVGVHTRTHPHLVRLRGRRLREEVGGALRRLRTTGLPVVPVLAYPYGEHDARVRWAVRRAGYAGALGMSASSPGRRGGRLALPRLEVRRTTDAADLAAAVLGGRPTPGPPPRRAAPRRALVAATMALVSVAEAALTWCPPRHGCRGRRQEERHTLDAA